MTFLLLGRAWALPPLGRESVNCFNLSPATRIRWGMQAQIIDGEVVPVQPENALRASESFAGYFLAPGVNVVSRRSVPRM